MTFPDLLPVAEVAKRFKVNYRTVHRWIRQGHLTATKATPGHTSPWLVTRESVEVFESQRAAA